MKSFILCFFVGVATAAQLPNSYIPPNAQSAGGSQFLQTPKSGGRPSNQYVPPTSSGYAGSSQQTQYSQNDGAQGYGQQQSQSQSADAQATILKYENNPNIGDGTYNYEYETSNGIKVQEQGYNTQQGDNSEQIVTGSYSYTGDDGQVYTVTYKADANGFQAEGAHLPTPPPIPEAIQKSLDFIAAENAKAQNSNNNQQTSYNRNAQVPRGQQGYASQQSQSYLPPNQQSYDSQNGYQY